MPKIHTVDVATFENYLVSQQLAIGNGLVGKKTLSVVTNLTDKKTVFFVTTYLNGRLSEMFDFPNIEDAINKYNDL